MARKSRKHIDMPGAIYHIVCRGNNQQRIFRSSRDYKKLLNIVRQVKKEKAFYFYSYNFLPNHFHFLIESQEVSISEIIGRINFLYAIYFNHRYNRSGHVFQDRFYSSVVDKEKYLWVVARYIDLNAVNAGLTENPEDHKWSSFPFYCQKDYEDDLIDQKKFLSYFGFANAEEARQEYVAFVREGVDKEEVRNPDFILQKTMR